MGAAERPAPRAPRRVTFGEALRFWVKLGWISFGGPAGQIAIMHRELVERRRWLSEERFLHALNYCMMLPGPEATQLAVYIGWLMHRTWGGIAAGVFFVLPSILVLLALSYTYAAYGNLPAVAGVLAGFKPVVVAIVVEAMWKIGGRALKRRAHFLIAAAAFVAIYFLRVPFPLIILGAALVGFASARFGKGVGEGVTGSRGVGESGRDGATGRKRSLRPVAPSPAHPIPPPDIRPPTPYVIDDHAPPPPHTLPSRGRASRVLALGLLLWLLPLLLLAAWLGPGGLHAREYFFFTQAALVTFGGAYAVLAYVTQAVTGANHDWLTPSQAVDGLALAETTPGPLIMVLQFIGFMAAWNNPAAGLGREAGAVLGALVTTYVTFLPCFIFIFIGAPYIEVIRGNRSLSGALAGVTAAVVGVILNLALVFGAAVIWPRGYSAPPDWFALLLSAAAFVALIRLKADVLWVVLAGGLLGLARGLLWR